MIVDPRQDAFAMGVVGGIGSGKSHIVDQWVKRWEHVFDVIVWTHNEKDLCTITTDQEARNKKRAAEGKAKERMLLIVDDKKALRYGRCHCSPDPLGEIVLTRCFRRITIIQMAQRYSQLNPTLRSSAKFLILFAESNPQERRALYTLHGFNDRKSFLQTIDNKTKEKYSWVGIKCYPSPPEFFTTADE